MKLGWIGIQPLKNKLLDAPLRANWFSTAPQGIFHTLYPDEDSALIDIENPDYELCGHMDAVLYFSGSTIDHLMLKVIDNIPCKVLICHEGGEDDFLRWSLESVLRNREIVNKSDLVLVWDTRSLGVHRLYSDKPVLWWPLPYPIEYMDRALSVSPAKIYDILVSYSPAKRVGTPRNAVLGCLLAQHFLDTMGFASAGVFSMADVSSGAIEAEKRFLHDFDCDYIDVIPRVSPKECVSMISQALVIINLDYRRASGRMTLESALTKIPVIASEQQPFAYQLYNGIKLHDSFDVVSMIETGIMIDEGRWSNEWLDLAYERAQHFSFANKAKVLEEAVLSL